MSGDGIKWITGCRVLKYSDEQVEWVRKKTGILVPDGDTLKRELNADPEDGIVVAEGNLLVTNGIIRLVNLFTGGGAAAFTNSQAIFGVGSSATAATVADTHLGSDAGTAWYQQMDATYPSTTGTNGVITGQASFSTSNSNFAWNEWCFAIGTSTITAGTTLSSVATSPTMLNHKIANLGTKASGTWVLQTTITFA